MTDKRPTTHDIAILGAGPAGMAAAAEVAAHGATVVVLDEQARPGGQLYRKVEVASPHQ
jgi:NADPH-dependent 2,4-dienoyl-CoA reductase/sulfur reductase-like enzyme